MYIPEIPFKYTVPYQNREFLVSKWMEIKDFFSPGIIGWEHESVIHYKSVVMHVFGISINIQFYWLGYKDLNADQMAFYLIFNFLYQFSFISSTRLVVFLTPIYIK